MFFHVSRFLQLSIYFVALTFNAVAYVNNMENTKHCNLVKISTEGQQIQQLDNRTSVEEM